MGAIHATPSSQNSFENPSLFNEKNNNSAQTKFYPSRGTLPFSKFSFVHDCLPNLGGKENRLLHEKVSSFWLKNKNDSKRKPKGKAVPESYTRIDSVTKQPIKVVSLTDSSKKVASEKISRSSTDLQTLKLHSISQPDLHKHYVNFSLSETLKYIGCYVYLRCRKIEGLKPSLVVSWIRGIDRSLILSGWQEQGFISQPNMIPLYMLLREVLHEDLKTLADLKGTIMSTLYMCYSYNGHEISYPLKPFITDNNRLGFWDRCMYIINNHSDKMLLINKDSKYYNEVQLELKTFGRSIERKEA